MHSLRNDVIVMFEPPSRQRRLARRRTLVLIAVIGVAAAGWLFGALSDPGPSSEPVALSAFTSS